MLVCVGEETFKSKKALYERLRGILYGYTLGSFVHDGDAKFLSEALRQANAFYEYPSEEPIWWRIQQQAFGRCPEFVFGRPDGTIENPSIKRLSLQKSKSGKSSKSAARRDILEQISAFRSSRWSPSGFTCEDPQCSYQSADLAEFEVDHIDPTFNEIFEFWCSDELLDPRLIPIEERKDPDGRMIEFGMAEPFAGSFRAYHVKRARLQLLCRGCHVDKTFRAYRNDQ